MIDESVAAKYYDSDRVGHAYGLPGGGLIGLLSGDHLHPPMVYDENIWKTGSLWRAGAIESTKRLAELAEIKGSHYVLDVGCGIGGPARYLAKRYGCRIHGINISELQTITARRLTKRMRLDHLVDFSVHDAGNLQFEDNCFDVVWTMNMFYHLPDKEEALKGFRRVLRRGGGLGF